MKKKHFLIITTFVLTISGCNQIDSVKASESNNNICHELPNFIIINKTQIDDSTFIVNCYLDDNSIHQFMDGEVSVNIIPIITNQNNGKIIYVDKKTLVGIDTVKLNLIKNNDKVFYSIMFPSPKGGDVTISKGLKIE